MSNFNLKAMNKKTGEITEFTALDNGDNYTYIHEIDEGDYELSSFMFNELYEVVEDEPLFKTYKIKFRRDDKFKLKPDVEEMDGKVLDFRFGWDIEDGIYKGEKAMIPRGYDISLSWVASGDLEEVRYIKGEITDFKFVGKYEGTTKYIVEEPNIMDRVNLKTISIDDGDGGFITVVESEDDPNHPYGGMEVLDNVPVTEESSTTETWKDRLKDKFWFLKDCYYIEKDGNSHVIDAIEPLKNFFQQELDRISKNFMTEFTDPDTGLLNISKYDHEEIINFFNREIK